MSKKSNKKSMRSCVKSLIREAESKAGHDDQASMRLSQSAVNITNAMMNLAALKRPS